jgi:Putative Flp pilus-assembly TadE/G-like
MLKRFARDERGQALVMTLVGLGALMGFMALAVDVGLLFRAKRNIQIAADAAAVAGALDYYHNGVVGTAKTAASGAATLNGYTTGGGTTVTVNCAPASGPHAGASCNGFFEAIITAPSPMSFMSMFGYKAVNVTARGVAGDGGPSNACVIVTNPSASDAMDLQGSFTISAAQCGVIVDSTDPDALQFTGAGGTLTAGSVGVVGGAGGHTGDSTPAPVTGAAPVSDPLKLTGPTPSNHGCDATGYTDPRTHQTVIGSSSTATSLTGNISAGGTNIAVCYQNAVSLNNVTFNPGIYVFENGVTTNGTITTNGATLDIYAGAFSVNSGTVLALTAPTSGETNGIALMEPSTNSSQITIQKGNATGSITGILYAPSAQLYLQDSGGDSSGGISLTADLIVNELFDKTATLTINSYSQSHPSTTPLENITLVE